MLQVMNSYTMIDEPDDCKLGLVRSAFAGLPAGKFYKGRDAQNAILYLNAAFLRDELQHSKRLKIIIETNL